MVEMNRTLSERKTQEIKRLGHTKNNMSAVDTVGRAPSAPPGAASAFISHKRILMPPNGKCSLFLFARDIFFDLC